MRLCDYDNGVPQMRPKYNETEDLRNTFIAICLKDSLKFRSNSKFLAKIIHVVINYV